MCKLLMVPGLKGSGPDHWQTHWEARLPNCERVIQVDWEHPQRAPWVATLLAAVDRNPDSILVAHSLGCALVANAVKERPHIKVRAALLVSPSDVDWVEHIEDPLRDFAPMPLGRLPFRTIVVASRNDPYVRLERARFFAEEWGAEFVDVGAEGHINADSQLGDWSQGLTILAKLME